MDNETLYANSVFEQPWWLDIVAPGKWDEVTVTEGTNVIARLPFVCIKERITRPHYTQTLGIWFNDSIKNKTRGNDHLSKQKNIIHDLLVQLPKKREIDFVFDSSIEYILPFRWEGYAISPTFSYRISNLMDMDTIEKSISKNVKRDINRGSRTLFLDDSPESVTEFIELQNLTYKRQNRKNPIENSFTEKVIRQTLDNSHGKLLIARDSEGKAHAGSFLVFDENVCYHLMSGQDTSFGNDCAMPFLLFNEINFARNVSKAFDFEGSMIEGIEQVYRRYGGNQVINWHVSKQCFTSEIKQIMKPKLKRIIGYKV